MKVKNQRIGTLYFTFFMLTLMGYYIGGEILKIQDKGSHLLALKFDILNVIILIISIVAWVILISNIKYFNRYFLVGSVWVELMIIILLYGDQLSWILAIVLVLKGCIVGIMSIAILIEISKISFRERQHVKIVLRLGLAAAAGFIVANILLDINHHWQEFYRVSKLILLLLTLLNLLMIKKFFPKENFLSLYQQRHQWFKNHQIPLLRGVIFIGFCITFLASFILHLYLRWLPNYVQIMGTMPTKSETHLIYCHYVAILVSFYFVQRIIRRVSPLKVLFFLCSGLMVTVILLEFFIYHILLQMTSIDYLMVVFYGLIIIVGLCLGAIIPLSVSSTMTAYRMKYQPIIAGLLMLAYYSGATLGKDIFEEIIGIPMVTAIEAPVIILFLLVVYFHYIRKMQLCRIKENE